MPLAKRSSHAILLLAYGTPEKFTDIEAYYTDVRRGNKPEPHLLKELQDRYQAIGGITPLRMLTEKQAKQLAARLGMPVYVGMKHWHPYIKDTVVQMDKDGVKDITALVLAPHYSTMSIGDYRKRAEAALSEVAPTIRFELIEGWGDNPRFIKSLCDRVERTLTQFSPNNKDNVHVIFSAHSLPTKILDMGDPYYDQLLRTSELAADSLGLPHWELSFQSAGRTRDSWLGPDILQRLEELAKSGTKQVLIAPIGFTTDNLEILYDIDIQAMERAKELGITLRRIPSANDSPLFIDALEDVIRTSVQL